jgi:DNA-binding MarR family transcriptional regulator
MNNPPTPFGTQLIGQAEKTMNAILDRLLAGRVSEPEWVTLVLIAGSGGSSDPGQLTARVALALKQNPRAASDLVRQLAAKGLVQIEPGPGPGVALTEAGRRLVGGLQQQTAEVTERLWGDLPAADLEVAGRVLRTVLERAEAELAAGPTAGPPSEAGLRPARRQPAR